MSSGYSNYWRNKLHSHAFGKEVYVAPSNYWVLLSLTQIYPDGTGILEPVGGSYSRVSTVSSDWSAVSAFEIQNASSVIFTRATGDWGAILYFGVSDSDAGGNLLAFGSLNPAVTILNTQQWYFPAGKLSITH